MVERSVDKDVMLSIRRYVDKIKSRYKIEAVFLFGSYARGDERECSDIDIAVVSEDFTDAIDDGAKLIGMTWKIDTRIEPHPVSAKDFKEAANPFVREIIDTGIRVA